jgi:hypothetical protein
MHSTTVLQGTGGVFGAIAHFPGRYLDLDEMFYNYGIDSIPSYQIHGMIPAGSVVELPPSFLSGDCTVSDAITFTEETPIGQVAKVVRP